MVKKTDDMVQKKKKIGERRYKRKEWIKTLMIKH